MVAVMSGYWVETEGSADPRLVNTQAEAGRLADFSLR
jgi:hypothetical protein